MKNEVKKVQELEIEKKVVVLLVDIIVKNPIENHQILSLVKVN